MILPRKVGAFTVVRMQDADDVSESFVGVLDEPAARRVLARRITGDGARGGRAIGALRERVAELGAVRHPSLARVFDVVEADGEVYVLEAWSDGVPLSEVLRFCLLQDRAIPIELFLYLATQLCDALEELHGRPAPGVTPGRHLLHLALCPAAVQVTVDGRVTLGRYGLFREGPLAAAHGVEYLAPEQTRPGPKLLPATDVFALGTMLYELLTRKPLFRTGQVGRTLERIRSADISTELVEVRDVLPGLEKVMFRALSANPQHRYQRAFVLREDLRGLMVGYSFGDIATVARAFLAPVVRAAYEWFVSGAHPVPRRAAPLGSDGSPETAVTVGAPAFVHAAPASSPRPREPITQWIAQGPTGVVVPLRRRPIDRLPDTARVPMGSPLPVLEPEPFERGFFDVPTERTLKLAPPLPPSLGDLGDLGDDRTEADLATAALDAPLPVSVASARPVDPEDTDTARLGPGDLEPIQEEVSQSRTALRVQGRDPDRWTRIDDVPMPAPLEILPSVGTAAVAEESDPEVRWGWAADPGRDSDTVRRHDWRPAPARHQRGPGVPLAVVALVTALLCILLCLGPPVGVLWAAAVNGTYPHEVMQRVPPAPDALPPT